MNILYISTFFIAAIVLYLVMNDFKKCKNILYNKIYYKIWIKTYILLTIIFIHFVWLFSQIFLDESDKNCIYGVPIYIYIPYLSLIIVQINDYLDKKKQEKEESTPSKKINKLINYIFILYFICILLFIAIPNDIKKYIIKYIRNLLD